MPHFSKPVTADHGRPALAGHGRRRRRASALTGRDRAPASNNSALTLGVTAAHASQGRGDIGPIIPVNRSPARAGHGAHSRSRGLKPATASLAQKHRNRKNAKSAHFVYIYACFRTLFWRNTMRQCSVAMGAGLPDAAGRPAFIHFGISNTPGALASGMSPAPGCDSSIKRSSSSAQRLQLKTKEEPHDQGDIHRAHQRALVPPARRPPPPQDPVAGRAGGGRMARRLHRSVPGGLRAVGAAWMRRGRILDQGLSAERADWRPAAGERPGHCVRDASDVEAVKARG